MTFNESGRGGIGAQVGKRTHLPKADSDQQQTGDRCKQPARPDRENPEKAAFPRLF